MEASSNGLARNCREAGRFVPDVGELTKPMGTTMDGEPVGGEIWGELFPAFMATQPLFKGFAVSFPLLACRALLNSRNESITSACRIAVIYERSDAEGKA